MVLSSDETIRLFRRGDFDRILAATGRNPDRLRALDPSHRVVVAHALAITGDLELARVIAEFDVDPRTPARDRAHAELVLGLVLWRQASLDAALRHFQSALRIAHESGDKFGVGWAHVHLFRCLMDSRPPDESVAMLPEVRRAVTRAGDPQITATLHSYIAVLAGQMGHLDEARRHCDILESVLERAPNRWILGNGLLTRATLATLTRDLDRAFDYVAAAKTSLATSGHSRALVACDAALAHLQLLSGDFDKARKVLESLIGDERTPRSALVGLGESLARVYLAEGELASCEETLSRVESEARQNPSIATYDARWAAITKAKLLVKAGRAAEAVAWLQEVAESVGTITDNVFTAELNLTWARAAGLAGDTSLAATRLFAAHEIGILSLRELQGQYYFGTAQLVGDQTPDLKRLLTDRALRVWDGQGVVATWLEMESRQLPSHIATKHLAATRHIDSPASVDIQCLTNGLASLSDLAYSPHLFGRELVGIIQALDCSQRVSIHRSGAGPKQPLPRNHVSLPIGMDRNKELTLTCCLPETAAKAVILADVLRIARAALELERTRQEERNRAAIWPAAPIEEQAGALFMSEEMQQLLVTARRIGPTAVPVLITGETGTGKEVLARTIHLYSTRAAATFAPFNCGGVQKDMLDSQLFGHRKGAFTGAIDNFQGVIRAASGGTLFLDEIGELSLDVQPKLLRFLENNEVHPIGEVQPVRADVRIIAATNANLDAMVGQGRFREDLLYRLNIIHLPVPPLRERRVEIPTLANHYLRKHAAENAKGDLRLAEETMGHLVLYRWPGNVRQLANEMRRIAALAEPGAVIMPEHLSPGIAAFVRTAPVPMNSLDPTEFIVRTDQTIAAAVQHVETTLIQNALRLTGGHMEDAAAMLGLSRKGLYLKRQRYGLEPPEPDNRDVA